MSLFFFLKRGNSLTMSLTQYHPANTLAHKASLHFEEKKLREQKQTRKGEKTEGGEGGRQSEDEEQWGGGHSLPKQL